MQFLGGQLQENIILDEMRRAGELLKQFNRQGTRTDKLSDAADRKLQSDAASVNFAPTQKDVADKAGMSERQRVTAVRIAEAV